MLAIFWGDFSEMECTYSVFCTGEIKPDFSEQEVYKKFAQLFKVDFEKAQRAIIRGARIKQGLSEETAKKYKDKLDQIGVLTRITPSTNTLEPAAIPSTQKNHTGEQPPKAKMELSLVPVEPNRNIDAAEQKSISESRLQDDHCPKCQAKLTDPEQCIECGIYIEKYLRANSEPPPQENQENSFKRSLSDDNKDQKVIAEFEPIFTSISTSAIITGAGIALLGAILWRFVALAFDVELGLIAWGIGAAIGFSVSMTGARGEKVGYLCAAFALVAIIGGKYLVASGLTSQFQATLQEESVFESLQQLYNEERLIAKQFMPVELNETSIRQLMVESEYSYATDSSQVTQEEVDEFSQFVLPRLQGLASDSIGYEEWLESMMMTIGSISTWDIFQESFGWLDYLFLFMGVGTAFRLGRGSGTVY